MGCIRAYFDIFMFATYFFEILFIYLDYFLLLTKNHFPNLSSSPLEKLQNKFENLVDKNLSEPSSSGFVVEQ